MWSHELRPTKTHWHIRPETYPPCYQDAAACARNWCLIWTVSCVAVQWN